MANHVEFELVSHSTTAYKFFLVNMVYRNLHFHKDFEICLLLDGEITVYSENQYFTFHKGEFWITNPFQGHELKAGKNALILALQISPEFFVSYFPQIENLNFQMTDEIFMSRNISEHVSDKLLDAACKFFNQSPYYEFSCASSINSVFELLLEFYPYKIISEKQKNRNRNHASRIRKMTDYIDAHYGQKLLLSDLAAQEGVTLSYLSHFFSDNMGMSFQEYLLRIRCEKARCALLLTDQTLLDISLSCGFSDVKYFNSGFKKQYGCSPKEYRKYFRHDDLPQQQQSMMSTQEFLSPETSFVVLQKYMETEKA